jgi:hypothetical protein
VRGWLVVLAITSACDAWRMHPHADDGPCNARWEVDQLEQRDPLTETWDAATVEPGPIWTGDLDGDGRRDVVLRYRGSRTHESVVLRSCGGDRYQVMLDEVRASQVGTTRGPDGWLELVLVDGKHRAEFKHGAGGYEGPPEQQMGGDVDWQ